MTDEDLERRLRAHFADRAATEHIPPAPDALPPARRRHRELRVLAAAALAVVVVVLALAALEDDDETSVDVADDRATTTSPTTSSTTTTTPGGATRPTVVITRDGILGIWSGTQWQPVDAAGTDLLRGGETLTLVHLGATGTVVAGMPEDGCRALQGEAPRVPFEGDDAEWPGAVAVAGVADPLPRPITEMSLDNPTYVAAASEVLATLGVEDPAPPLVQLLRVDLDGDGTDEILMVAERHDPAEAFGRVGDYSVVVLRRVVSGNVEHQVVASSVVTEVTVNGNPASPETAYIDVFRLSAVADLNGDGDMEVTLGNLYYEGSGSQAFELRADELVRVLDGGCGA